MKNHGFSLIEVVVVIAIAAILMAISHLPFAEMQRKEILKADLLKLESEIRAAQIANIAQGKVSIIVVGDNAISKTEYASDSFNNNSSIDPYTPSRPGMPLPTAIYGEPPPPVPTPQIINLKTTTTGYSTLYIDRRGIPYTGSGYGPTALCIATGAMVVHGNQIRIGSIQSGHDCKPEEVVF